MKHIFFSAALIFAALMANAQTTIATFDTLPLGVDTFWNGTLTSTGFADGDAFFVTSFDTATYGGVLYDNWSGFAYSNMYYTDTVVHSDSVLTNAMQFSTVTGGGYGGSSTFAVAYDAGNTKIYLTGSAKGAPVAGFYATNTEYAYLSMKYGDAFEPKFTYANKDSFVLKITGWYNGSPIGDTVSFYLADFRDSLVSPGILTTWQWVSLTSLGNADSLIFSFASSQTGQFGINTPTYFALDNFTTQGATGISQLNANTIYTNAYPNPFSNSFRVNYTGNLKAIQVFDLQGNLLKTVQGSELTSGAEMNTTYLAAGAYLARVITDQGIGNTKIVKQ
jgi:hypothetical protein